MEFSDFYVLKSNAKIQNLPDCFVIVLSSIIKKDPLNLNPAQPLREIQ